MVSVVSGKARISSWERGGSKLVVSLYENPVGPPGDGDGAIGYRH